MNKLKNKRPMENTILLIVAFFPFPNIKGRESNIIYDDIFSKLSPIMNEVIVVAMLLPSMIPILLLKVRRLAFIRLIVIIITAELDWISAVVMNPVVKLFVVDDVMLFSWFLILGKDNDVSVLLRRSIE